MLETHRYLLFQGAYQQLGIDSLTLTLWLGVS